MRSAVFVSTASYEKGGFEMTYNNEHVTKKICKGAATPQANDSQSATPGYTFEDFVNDNVRIDFREFTIRELNQLRRLCKMINHERDVPAYTFGKCYYVRQGRWCEGGKHQLRGKLCRATEVVS